MDSQKPFVSLIVVTHDRPQFLATSIESIAAQTWTSRELVVVLNPADEESEMLARRSANKIVKTHRNIGFFPALNFGIANSSGSMVMVVDDDALLESNDVVERLVRYLQSNPSIWAVTCNIRGPCEGTPYRAPQLVASFKTGFTMYRREIFTQVAGHVPDNFYRAGGESYLAGYIYEHGGAIAVLPDVWMYHAQTIQGRDTYAMNFFAVRNHALLAVLQEPIPIVPLSLAVKLWSSFIRIAVQRSDPLAWLLGWLSFAGNLAWAIRERRPISLRTYLHLRGLRKEATGSHAVVVQQSGDAASNAPRASRTRIELRG